MRTAVAAALAVLVLATVLPAHVHAGAAGADRCAVCLARSADVARSETPDVAPLAFPEGEASRSPGLPPVAGAPLGAVPGQSPPAA
jgi:hypothetical protein